jgi:hypothetical protein
VNYNGERYDKSQTESVTVGQSQRRLGHGTFRSAKLGHGDPRMETAGVMSALWRIQSITVATMNASPGLMHVNEVQLDPQTHLGAL